MGAVVDERSPDSRRGRGHSMGAHTAPRTPCETPTASPGSSRSARCAEPRPHPSRSPTGTARRRARPRRRRRVRRGVRRRQPRSEVARRGPAARPPAARAPPRRARGGGGPASTTSRWPFDGIEAWRRSPCPRSSSRATTTRTPAIRTRWPRSGRSASRTRGWSARPRGESPLAWQGGRLSREIAAFAEEPAVRERLGS